MNRARDEAGFVGRAHDVSEPPSDEAIEAAMASVGYRMIEVDCPEKLVRKDHEAMYVDLSGWAKGWKIFRR